MKTVNINASKSYDVIIGEGVIHSLGKNCASLFGKCKALIVTDTNVARYWLEEAKKNLQLSGIETVEFIFPAGEESKNSKTLFDLVEFAAENKLTRSDFFVALGGGVTGDMTGLAASLYLRGIPFVQVPTSLLAAVDSSVGGKTAVNLKSGKNLMGAFYQPTLVICDINTLSTLPKEEFANGMAEVIKYGAIFDKDLFDKVKSGDVKSDMENIIARCIELKRDVVAEDEFDNGNRQLLNFGHTMAHSIEKCSNFEISHGSAVAIGMVIAAKASASLGWSNEDCSDAIIQANRNNNLPTECSFSAQKMAEIALSDKKRAGGFINFVVPEILGKCILKKIPVEDLFKIAEYR